MARKPSNSEKPASAADVQALMLLASTLERRLALGSTFEGERRVWKSCGYPDTVENDEMELRYARFGMARTIVDAYPEACWAKDPNVFETDDEAETEFERAWAELLDQHQVFYKLKTLDSYAGRGSFSILLLGFDDGGTLASEVPQGTASKLLFIRQYLPAKVTVKEFETDTKNPRYGMPKLYVIKKVRKGTKEVQEEEVHWTRVVHLCEPGGENDWEGEHRLKKVFNHLLDIEKIAGGGSEAYWKAGFPGHALLLPADAAWTSQDSEDLDDQIAKFYHGLTRTLRLKGITPEPLNGQLADPSGPFLMNVQLISAATGVPQRKLLGSEQAQLASEQDSLSWLDRVDTRRVQFCTPKAVLPFVERLQWAGVLPEAEVQVEWPPIKARTDAEKADISVKKTEAIVKYASSPGAMQVMPLYFFLTEVLEYDDEKAKAIVADVEQKMEEEESELEEARRQEEAAAEEEEVGVEGAVA